MSQTRNLSVYSAACALEESLAALAAQVFFKALARLSEDSKLNRALIRSSWGEASGEGAGYQLF
jgi:hypothetical protein